MKPIKKIKKALYNTSRNTAKAGSIVSDIEAIASLNVVKIVKRFGNKTKNKIVYGTARKIQNKINKR